MSTSPSLVRRDGPRKPAKSTRPTAQSTARTAAYMREWRAAGVTASTVDRSHPEYSHGQWSLGTGPTPSARMTTASPPPRIRRHGGDRDSAPRSPAGGAADGSATAATCTQPVGGTATIDGQRSAAGVGGPRGNSFMVGCCASTGGAGWGCACPLVPARAPTDGGGIRVLGESRHRERRSGSSGRQADAAGRRQRGVKVLDPAANPLPDGGRLIRRGWSGCGTASRFPTGADLNVAGGRRARSRASAREYIAGRTRWNGRSG